MRFAVTISTPKHAHIWRHPIRMLRAQGHQVLPLLRDYRETIPVAGGLNIEGPIFGASAGGGLQRATEYPRHVLGHYLAARKFKPDVLTGYGVFESHSALVLRRPSIGWNDTEYAPGQNRLIRRLATCVCVPSSFRGEVFGSKQVRFNGYLELSYLHPRRFKPDPSILASLGVRAGERYAIVRLNAFDATHDIAHRGKGFTQAMRTSLVQRLAEHGRVFISAEAQTPPELESFGLHIPPHRIHDALAFADLYVGDGGTMQNEAAILGTPSVRLVVNPEANDLGNGKELEKRYGLLHNFYDAQAAANKAVELFAGAASKAESSERRQEMLSEQIDVAAFMVWFLTHYPESEAALRKDAVGTQAQFRMGRNELTDVLA